jgi:glutaryl-CoA dehydrogenase
MSLRASVTSALYFDQMRIPHSCLLPKADGIKAALSCLTQARFGISWGAIGAALACFTEALEYSKERVLFQRPLSDTQTIQRRLADMARKITCSQLLAFQLAKLKDAGNLDPVQVSLAKWNNVRSALEIARDARDLLGGNGITLDYCAIRHLLNLESVITYEGTETVHELVIGRCITGSNAF